MRYSMLSLALSTLVLLGVLPCMAENMVFPEDANLVDVTKEPYLLKGDGETDNTAALQKAFDELRGKNQTLYFPNGTYLFKDQVGIFGGKPHSSDRFIHLQGQSEAGVVLKLADEAAGFDDAEKPKTFISMYEGKSTGDWMHGYIRNLTVDVGSGNPGAAGIRFMSNNSGAVYDLTVRSSDPEKAGAIGLDLRQSQNGPALIKRVTVDGFDYGIEVNNTFSLVFEHITLSDQRKVGLLNENGRLTIRGLTSRNAVPAIDNVKHGQLTLIEADLTGGASDATAIKSERSKLFLRDITTKGYAHTVQVGKSEPVDGDLREWYPGKGYALFDVPAVESLRLPIEETPEIPWEQDLSKWVKVELPSEADPNPLQTALDKAAAEGKTTIYFPKETSKKREAVVTAPVRVHGSVNRIIGMENILWISEDIPVGGTVFTFEDLDGPIVFERFFNVLKHKGWKGLKDRYLFENTTQHPVILRNFAKGAGRLKRPQPGTTWFIEDVPTHLEVGRDEKVWARQLNPESPKDDMVTVHGGQVWILGLKTEGRARHVVATHGAKVELLGGVSYQSWKNQELDPPVFDVTDSEASFTIGFYHYNLPFTTIVSETRDGETRTLERKQLDDYHLPLYRASGGDTTD